jgi:hypothetical protein
MGLLLRITESVAFGAPDFSNLMGFFESVLAGSFFFSPRRSMILSKFHMKKEKNDLVDSGP